MNDLLSGLLGVLLATNQPLAISNMVAKTTGLTVNVPNPDDPVEQEYQRLLTDDDTAQAEVDKWIRDNESFEASGAGISQAILNLRIQQRFDPVRKAYENFLQRHPEHVRARIAYASFLGDTLDTDGALAQLEKARQLDPNNPAIWNNLGNVHNHRAPVSKMFEYYGKAIELDPAESAYYRNLANVVATYRKDAREFYQITEAQVFDKALDLYGRALKLDPQNFVLATEMASSFYDIKPQRWADAVKGWEYALQIATGDFAPDGVRIHLGRLETWRANFDKARQHLNAVTNTFYADRKALLLNNVAKAENAAKGTNAPAAPVPQGR